MRNVEGYAIFPDQHYDSKNRKPSSYANLVRDAWDIPEPNEDEVWVKVLAVCMEGNMGHAYEREPIDVPRDRREPWVILGNAGVVQVLETGKNVKGLKEGDECIVFCNGKPDKYGFPEKIYAYDHPGSYGLLARETKMKDDQLIKIPEGSALSREQWAAFSLRGITAYSNWRFALHVYRGQVRKDQHPILNVGAWGGGVSLLEAQLAASYGHNAFMLSSSLRRLGIIERLGIKPLDRYAICPALDYATYKKSLDAEQKSKEAYDRMKEDRNVLEILESAFQNSFTARFSDKSQEEIGHLKRTALEVIDSTLENRMLDAEATYRQALGEKEAVEKAYRESRKCFLEKMKEVTGGEGVDIFIDYIGEPVFPATLEAMARQGVITTAGWKEGMVISQVRAIECIKRIERIQTHYASREEGIKAVELAQEGRMTPLIHESERYTFDTVPEMFRDFVGHEGHTDGGYYVPKGFVFFPVATFV